MYFYFRNLPNVVGVKARNTLTRGRNNSKASSSLESSDNVLKVKVNVQQKSVLGTVKRGRPRKTKEPEELVKTRENENENKVKLAKHRKPNKPSNSDSTSKKEAKKSQGSNISLALEGNANEVSDVSENEVNFIESTEILKESKRGKDGKPKKDPNSDSTSKEEAKKNQNSNIFSPLEENEQETSNVFEISNGIVTSKPLKGQEKDGTGNDFHPDYSPLKGSVSRDRELLNVEINTIINKLSVDSESKLSNSDSVDEAVNIRKGESDTSNCHESTGYGVYSDLLKVIEDKMKTTPNTGKDNWQLKDQKAISQIYTTKKLDSSSHSCYDEHQKSRISENGTQKFRYIIQKSPSKINYHEGDSVPDMAHQLNVSKQEQKGCEDNTGEPKRNTGNVTQQSSNSSNCENGEWSQRVEANGSADNDTERSKGPSDGEENILEPKGHNEIVIQESNSSANRENAEASKQAEAKGSADNDTEGSKGPSDGKENIREPKGHNEIVIQKSNLSANSENGESSQRAEAKGSADNDTERSKGPSDGEENILEPKGHNEIVIQNSILSANSENGEASKQAEADGTADKDTEISKGSSDGEENICEPKGHNEIIIQKSNSSANSENGEASKEADAKQSADNDIERLKGLGEGEENIGKPKGHNNIVIQKLSTSANSERSEANFDEAGATGSPENDIERKKSISSTKHEIGETFEEKDYKGSDINGSEGNEWQKGENMTDAELLELVTVTESKLNVQNEEQKQSKENVDPPNENIDKNWWQWWKTRLQQQQPIHSLKKNFVRQWTRKHYFPE